MSLGIERGGKGDLFPEKNFFFCLKTLNLWYLLFLFFSFSLSLSFFFFSFLFLLQLSVGIENGNLESYNSDFELQFSHPLKNIVGMCRIVHKQGGKQVGNGFMQLKTTGSQQQQSQGSNSGGGSLSGSNGTHSLVGGVGIKSSLKTSTSYGSLSSSAAASYQQQQQHQQQQQQQQQQDDQNAVPNNFMEFTGPLTGLVYLMKEPKDPLLHIYLFECEAVEEVSVAHNIF